MKKLTAVIFVIFILLLSLAGCSSSTTSNETKLTTQTVTGGLNLHFIDVGQGDCTLIESEGRYALIDAGEYSESNKVVSYLSEAGVKELDYIIATHPHSDHVGGLSEVIRSFKIGALLCTNAPVSSSWEYVMDAADERGVTYEIPSPYEFYQLGGATITVLAPSEDAVYSNLNDYSIVTMIEYGNTSALLTGDAEKGVEKELVNSSYDLSADILKCGHHGSSTSSCAQFLDAVAPDAVVISCGEGNDYGHPHEETISALSDRNIPIWRTDLSGTIVASSNGESFTFSTTTESTVIEDITLPDELFVGNKNSKVFHYSGCGSVDNMKKENKVSFKSYDEAIEAGYKPCGSCKP